MEIRKYLNENPLVAYGLAGGLVLAAIVFGIWYAMSGSAPPPLTSKPDFTKGFYSDDDGKTYFVDSVKKAAPFNHNGKEAVRAYLFRCGSTTFVGLLGRNTKVAVSRPDAADLGADYKLIAVAIVVGSPPIFEIKKPGSAKWTPITNGGNDPWHQELLVQCPGGGSDIPIVISPGQQ
jgi:hypothetical protein